MTNSISSLSSGSPQTTQELLQFFNRPKRPGVAQAGGSGGSVTKTKGVITHAGGHLKCGVEDVSSGVAQAGGSGGSVTKTKGIVVQASGSGNAITQQSASEAEMALKAFAIEKLNAASDQFEVAFSAEQAALEGFDSVFETITLIKSTGDMNEEVADVMIRNFQNKYDQWSQAHDQAKQAHNELNQAMGALYSTRTVDLFVDNDHRQRALTESTSIAMNASRRLHEMLGRNYIPDASETAYDPQVPM